MLLTTKLRLFKTRLFFRRNFWICHFLVLRSLLIISDFKKYSIELVKTSLLRAESGKKCPKGLQGPTLFQILRYLFFSHEFDIQN